MKNVFGIALGILAAIGGFVDIGDIVFNVAAGATFGYQLLWAVVLGSAGSSRTPRCAGASLRSRRPPCSMRSGSGSASRSAWSHSSPVQLVNLLTLVAEIGGIAIALQLLSGLPYRALLVLAVLGSGSSCG